MTATVFDSTKDALHDLLQQLREGKIQLPDFQRGWVWDDDHIRDVIASVARAFPIGAVMMLETGGEAKFQPRPVQGISFAANAEVEPERLILDGQQRLTSLYQALMLGEVVDTKNSRGQKIKRWYYLDMGKALGAPESMEEAIVGIPEERKVLNFRGEVIADYSSPEKEYKAGLFPVWQIYEDDDWEDGYLNHWGHDPEKSKFYRNFRREVLQVFKTYQLPVITLRKQTHREAVCLVFEKVNTGGVTLTAFELLTATYAASNFNLRDDWHGNKARGVAGRQPQVKQFAVLKSLESTDFLQAVSLLNSYEQRQQDLANGRKPEDATAVSCKRATILNLPLEGYKAWAGPALEGFKRAAQFLSRQKVFDARDLPYRTQVVPLAAILASLGQEWDNDGIQAKLARWYWSGVFGELYGSAVETRFALDLPQTLAWLKGGAEPKTVAEAVFIPTRIHSLRTRNSAAYKGVHALLMREGAEDFRSGQAIQDTSFWQEAIDIHHVFPRAWCVDRKIEAERYNCIVNKTPVSARTNRIIGGKAPSLYLERLEKSAEIPTERMDQILGSHLVDPIALRADDFEAFFAAREQGLLARIGQAMGKAVDQTQHEPEPVTEEEEDEEDLE